MRKQLMMIFLCDFAIINEVTLALLNSPFFYRREYIQVIKARLINTIVNQSGFFVFRTIIKPNI